MNWRHFLDPGTGRDRSAHSELVLMLSLPLTSCHTLMTQVTHPPALLPATNFSKSESGTTRVLGGALQRASWRSRVEVRRDGVWTRWEWVWSQHSEPSSPLRSCASPPAGALTVAVEAPRLWLLNIYMAKPKWVPIRRHPFPQCHWAPPLCPEELRVRCTGSPTGLSILSSEHSRKSIGWGRTPCRPGAQRTNRQTVLTWSPQFGGDRRSRTNRDRRDVPASTGSTCDGQGAVGGQRTGSVLEEQPGGAEQSRGISGTEAGRQAHAGVPGKGGGQGKEHWTQCLPPSCLPLPPALPIYCHHVE